MENKEFYRLYGRRNDISWKEFKYLSLNRYRDYSERLQGQCPVGSGKPDSYEPADPNCY